MDQSKITEIRIETRWNQFWLHAVTLQSHISVETKYEFNILIFRVLFCFFFRRCRRFAVVSIQYTDSKNQTFNCLHGVQKFLALANSFLWRAEIILCVAIFFFFLFFVFFLSVCFRSGFISVNFRLLDIFVLMFFAIFDSSENVNFEWTSHKILYNADDREKERCKKRFVTAKCEKIWLEEAQ